MSSIVPPCASATWLLGLLAIGAGCGPAPLARAGNIAVVDGHAFPSIEGSLAAFVSVRNQGRDTATIVGFETPDAAQIMLHRNEATGGMIRMMHQSELVLPPGSTVTMRSGELHLMLEGLGREMLPGDSLRVRLVLTGERLLEVVLPVEGFGDRDGVVD